MERDRSPTHSPPPAKCQKQSSTTTVASLGDDILLEIFLHLPSLATLVRAALTCRGWRRAVASSPAFRRRFREIHPAPLLGLFFNPPDAAQDPALPAFPSFVPTRGTDRDQAAAVRGGDFFLTSLQERHGVENGWDMHDCRGGYLLLANADQETMAVTNPLARRSERFFDFGHEDTREGHRVHGVVLDACLLRSDEDRNSFRVVMIAHDESRVRATVFNSDTGEWSVRPWVDMPARPRRGKFWLQDSNMQTNGFLYWVYKNCKYMVSLNTATMDFSVAKLPVFLKNPLCSFLLGELNNGEPCIVYAINFTVGVLLRKTESDGVERWVLDRAEILETQLGLVLGKLMENYNDVQVVAVSNGFVYLATSERSNDFRTPGWFLSLCLETMKLEKLFQRTYDNFVQPYVISWPPSLVTMGGLHLKMVYEIKVASYLLFFSIIMPRCHDNYHSSEAAWMLKNLIMKKIWSPINPTISSFPLAMLGVVLWFQESVLRSLLPRELGLFTSFVERMASNITISYIHT